MKRNVALDSVFGPFSIRPERKLVDEWKAARADAEQKEFRVTFKTEDDDDGEYFIKATSAKEAIEKARKAARAVGGYDFRARLIS